MKTRAAVAWELASRSPSKTWNWAGPKAGEVLVRIVATGVCHTDAFTLSARIRKVCFRRSSVTKAAHRSRKSVRA